MKINYDSVENEATRSLLSTESDAVKSTVKDISQMIKQRHLSYAEAKRALDFVDQELLHVLFDKAQF